MKRTQPKKTDFDIADHALKVRWFKALSELHDLMEDGRPEDHVYDLLTIATVATHRLNVIVMKNPKLVEGIAEGKIIWPFLISPMKNDRGGYDFARGIRLGVNVTKVTSKSPLRQAVALVAEDVLQKAHDRHRRAVDDKKTAVYLKLTATLPPDLLKRYREIAALPPLSKGTFEKWRVTVFKPEFDAMWTKIKDAPAWREPLKTAARTPNGNILEYCTEANLKNHARKRVMTAIKALLPME